ncbi:hypothetical protein V2I01_38635 [Micromonospora sp. BRA006-A]|nr:hypothetical protein [Micromonospora sp. BRA006-A]
MVENDLRYEPPQHSFDWLEQPEPATCLVVGEAAESDRDVVSTLAGEVRQAPANSLVRLLHQGTYAFKRAGSWHAAIVTSGGEPARPERARSRYTEDGHLVHAGIVYEALWPGAEAFAGQAKFRRGDMVRTQSGAGGIGRVKEALPLADTYQYQVDCRGRSSATTKIPSYWSSATREIPPAGCHSRRSAPRSCLSP